MQNVAELHINLEKACIDFESAQDEQLEALKSGIMKDIMTMHDRRESAFRRLNKCLEEIAVHRNGRDDKVFLEELQERLGRLLETEKSLNEAAARCQKGVKNDLSELRKGKTALKGYSIKHGRAPGARFMSNRS